MAFYGVLTDLGKKAIANAMVGTAPAGLWIAFGSGSATSEPAETTEDITGEHFRVPAFFDTDADNYAFKVWLTDSSYTTTVPAAGDGETWCQIGIYDAETDGNLLYTGYNTTTLLASGETQTPLEQEMSSGDTLDVEITFKVQGISW